MGIWVILAISMSSILLAGGFDSKFKKHPIFDQEDFFKEEPEPPKKVNLNSGGLRDAREHRTRSYKGPAVCEERLMDFKGGEGRVRYGYCFTAPKNALEREDGRCRVPNHILLSFRFDEKALVGVDMIGPVKRENEDVMEKLECWRRSAARARSSEEFAAFSTKHGCHYQVRIDYCTSRWLRTRRPKKLGEPIKLGW